MPVARRLPVPAIFVLFGLMSGIPAAPTMAFQSTQDATVTVVHGLPNFTADVYVNGDLLLDGFKPKSEAGPLEVPPGVYHIAIRDVGASPSSEPALSGSVRLRPGANYSIVAHLDGNGEPALSAYQNPESPIPPGQARVVVRAVATLPPLTVEANGKPVASGVPAGGQESSLVPPGSYVVEVFAGEAAEPVVPGEDLHMREGSAYVLYVVGSGRDESLGLMVQQFRELASAPSGVQSGNGGHADQEATLGWRFWAQLLGGTVLLLVGIVALRRRQPNG